MDMSKQTMPVFYVNKTKFKPQAAVEKSEIKVFNKLDSICNTLGFKYMDVI